MKALKYIFLLFVEVFVGTTSSAQDIAVKDDFPVDMDNVRLTTRDIAFGDVVEGQEYVAVLWVLNMHSQPFRPSMMHVPPYLKVTPEPECLAGGCTGRIFITLDSNGLPGVGLTRTSIYLSRYHGDKVSEENRLDVSAVLLPGAGDTFSISVPRMMVDADTIDLGAWERRTKISDMLDGVKSSPVLAKLGAKKIRWTGNMKKSKLSGVMEIGNNGTSPLKINRMQVSSNAISVSLGARTINPGKKTALKVKVEKKRLVGSDDLYVTMFTNDPRSPKQRIKIKVK